MLIGCSCSFNCATRLARPSLGSDPDQPPKYKSCSSPSLPILLPSPPSTVNAIDSQHHVQINSFPSPSLSNSPFTTPNKHHPKCHQRPPLRRSPPPRHLPPRLPRRRRRLARRPQQLERRRSARRRARRPTLHTFTKASFQSSSRVGLQTLGASSTRQRRAPMELSSNQHHQDASFIHYIH